MKALSIFLFASLMIGCEGTGIVGHVDASGDESTLVDSISDGVDVPDDILIDEDTLDSYSEVLSDGLWDTSSDVGFDWVEDLPIDPPEHPVDTVTTISCTEGHNSTYISGATTGTSLHMIGIYEAGGESSAIDLYIGPMCMATSLILAAYHSARWNIHITPYASIDKIYVYSSSPQELIGVDGVEIEELTPLPDPPYFGWPTRWDDIHTRLVVADVESRSGLLLTSFIGCYGADEATVYHICD